MTKERIAVIGGDKRLKHLIDIFRAEGHSVCAFGVMGATDQAPSLSEALQNVSSVILPYPISPDGVYLSSSEGECRVRLDTLFSEIARTENVRVYGGGIKESVRQTACSYGIELTDYGVSEALQIKNALCTAEGAIEVAMGELDITLSGAVFTVIGYGRIGSLLGKRLTALGARVYAVTRSPEKLAAAFCDGCIPFGTERLSECISISDAVFNTAPATVLDKERLPYISKGCPVIDLASAPGGVDTEEAKRLGIKVIWALSLPGKYSPKTAASIIADAVREHFDRTRNR
jgi:dipicolinate synthase subunit A